MEERIRTAIEEALAVVGASSASFSVERPAHAAHGDYATNAALVAAKALKQNPRAVAEALVERISAELRETISKIEVAGPGFINLTLARGAVNLIVAEADAQGSEWGKGKAEAGKRVMVEYSNPNAFKEMHIGHLVGSIIGEALSRLIENEGARVGRDTFGGDVGPHVAKALWALQKHGVTDIESVRQIGEAYVEGSRAYEEDSQAKAQIDALNQAIYAGKDQQIMNLWAQGREVSMEEFRRLWKILGTHFDFEFFDSDTTEGGLRLVREGLAKGIFKQSDGAIIYDGEGKGVHTMVFITSHATPTYEAKDIGLAFLREERWPSDHVIIVAGNEQTGRFKTVFAALAELAPLLAQKTEHVPNGFLRLASGKMSSREGNVITVADFLAEIMAKAAQKNPDPLIAEQVAVGAIKYMVLRQAPGQDIVFDPEKSLSLEGDSGPYLQYALVRAKSVLAQAKGEGKGGVPEEPYLLERVMLHFPEVAARAARELAPNLLVNYLTELAGEWNSFYAKERIIGGEYEAHKLMLARAFAHTMENGLRLLGIPTPEKM